MIINYRIMGVWELIVGYLFNEIVYKIFKNKYRRKYGCKDFILFISNIFLVFLIIKDIRIFIYIDYIEKDYRKS